MQNRDSSTSVVTISYKELAGLAAAAGLLLTGVAPCRVLSLDLRRLADAQQRGYLGEMTYMNRSSELFADPRQLLPTARSIVSFAVHYDRGPHSGPLPKLHGRVARYAWGRDYHKVLRKVLRKLVASCEARLGSPLQARVFTDAVPLLERAWAVQANLGFVGKNTMLIRPGEGSFFFLAEMVWEVEVTDLPDTGSTGQCGRCTRCRTACPTEALVADRALDARRCISYLTIEKRTALSIWERQAIGEWIFGCDICQDVCPFNHQIIRGKFDHLPSALDRKGGIGPFLDLGAVLQLRDDDAFRSRFGGTALLRATRAGLIRNAAVVAANTDAHQLWPELKVCVTEDVSPLVRQHALWALSVLGVRSGQRCAELRDLLTRARTDASVSVQSEAQTLLEQF